MNSQIKVPYTSPATYVTQNKIHPFRLRDEIQFLYEKKAKLNKDLYNTHLQDVQEWGNMWCTILDSIRDSINQEMEK